MKTLLLIIVLFLNTISKADIIIVPMGDILFEVPNFEAPKMNLGYSMKKDVENKTKKNNKQIKNKIFDIFRDQYPTAQKIEIINQNIVITLP